jgi:F-box domain
MPRQLNMPHSPMHGQMCLWAQKDVVEGICKRLDDNDVVAARHVCKDLKRAIDGTLSKLRPRVLLCAQIAHW